jgi:hypothetical protein
MSKSLTRSKDCEVVPAPAMATVQIPLPMAAILQDAKQGLLELMVSTGVQVFEAMLEQDREALCGPRWQRKPERCAVRGGSTRSAVTLGRRRMTIQRPRARGERELALPSFTWASGRDPLDERTVEAIALGVSSRDYRRSLEALPSDVEERSVSRSSVSRRFVALSAERLAVSTII